MSCGEGERRTAGAPLQRRALSKQRSSSVKSLHQLRASFLKPPPSSSVSQRNGGEALQRSTLLTKHSIAVLIPRAAEGARGEGGRSSKHSSLHAFARFSIVGNLALPGYEREAGSGRGSGSSGGRRRAGQLTTPGVAGHAVRSLRRELRGQPGAVRRLASFASAEETDAVCRPGTCSPAPSSLVHNSPAASTRTAWSAT